MPASPFLRSTLLLALSLAPTLAWCGTSSSASYVISRSTFDTGGGISTSTSYTLYSAIGQSSPVGPASSASYTLYSGFISITDSDGDGVLNGADNCPAIANPDQLDTDSDGLGDLCDPDDDNDGLDDSVEATLGTNPLLIDSDGDGLSDYDEVNTDGNPADYQAGVDTDPNNPDTDGDGLNDGVDPDPLLFFFGDGDLAPHGAPDGNINAADLLVAERIVHGQLTATALDLSHGDVYPPGAPDGVIDLSDLLLIRQLVMAQP